MLLPLIFATLAASRETVPVRVDGILCHPSQLFVRTTATATDAQIAAAGVKVIRRIPEIGYVIVETPPDMLQVSRARLATNKGVLSVELDRAARPTYEPNDYYWPNMWHPKAIKVDKAWDISLGTNVPIVAVIDTGLQTDHPDLQANVWVNKAEIPNNGIDDDHNGYVDDVNGYDFAYNDPVPDDQYGHGTACAGLVAGVGDNSIGVTGTAPRARLMGLKVSTDAGYFYSSATVPAYIYGAKMGARIFSMSYYADGVQPAEEVALKWAFDHGVLPIAAAGNDSTVYPYYPGNYEFVLAVAALDTNLHKASFSDYGSWVDVASPGVSLYTTTTGSGYTGGFAGTSGATPIVSGLAALMLGAAPSATTAQLRTAIEDTAVLQSQAGYGEFSNYGMIDALAAMKAITGVAAPRKSTVVRWISPIGSYVPRGAERVTARVYGRTLDKATVQVAGSTQAKVGSSRDWTDYQLPTTSGTVTVKAGSTLVATVTPPLKAGLVYPMIEASAPNSSVSGGFFQTIRDDGSVLTTQADADGSVFLQATFRNLPSSGAFVLTINHRYSSTKGGVETLQMYDWKSRSYPYAGWFKLGTPTAPTTMTRLDIPIRDIAPMVDFNGNIYFRITANGLRAGTTLSIDSAYLRPGSVDRQR